MINKIRQRPVHATAAGILIFALLLIGAGVAWSVSSKDDARPVHPASTTASAPFASPTAEVYLGEHGLKAAQDLSALDAFAGCTEENVTIVGDVVDDLSAAIDGFDDSTSQAEIDDVNDSLTTAQDFLSKLCD